MGLELLSGPWCLPGPLPRVEAQPQQSAAAAAGIDEVDELGPQELPTPPLADDGADEEVEEAKPPVPSRGPLDPTHAEWEAHQATHLPYRSWCAHCVAGRSDNPPHRRAPADREEPAIPERIWTTPS